MPHSKCVSDGSILGHLRTNAVGANLNREWAATGDHQAPTADNSPEVLCVLAEVDRVGCDFFMDVSQSALAVAL